VTRSTAPPPPAGLLHQDDHASGDDLAQQLDLLAGFERGLVHAVQAELDSSEEDVFAHGFGLDES
jgi:hypothetical protein